MSFVFVGPSKKVSVYFVGFTVAGISSESKLFVGLEDLLVDWILIASRDLIQFVFFSAAFMRSVFASVNLCKGLNDGYVW